MRSTVKNIKDALIIDGTVFLVVFAFVSINATMTYVALEPLLVAALSATTVAIMIGFASGLYADPMARSRRMYKKAAIGFTVGVAIGILIILMVDMSAQVRTGLILGLPTGAAAMLAVRPVGQAMTRSKAVATRLLVLAPAPLTAPLLPDSGQGLQSFSLDGVVIIASGDQPADDAAARIATFAAQTTERGAIVVSGSVQIDDRLSGALSSAMKKGCRIITLTGLTGMIGGKVPLDDPDVMRMLIHAQEMPARTARLMERAIDIAVSATLLVTSAPLIIAMALAIWFEDGGPVIFRQTRIGLHSKPFTLLKFRTMRQNAESGGASQWASKGDQRVTRIGAYLRNHRLDELPQLINVLKGEMSLVGPRPERPDLVESLSAQIPMYNFRHLSRPGLSGWAQVNFPYAASIEDTREKTRYDLFYVLHHSPILNIIILLQTMRVVIFAEGAR